MERPGLPLAFFFGSSDKRVHLPRIVDGDRLDGWERSTPNPLSLWERARVREFLRRQTFVSARIIEWIPCLLHQQVRIYRMNRKFFKDVIPMRVG